MIERINFDNLTPNEFENFCCDLLLELGCHEINWRKGTAKQSSPSDFGRDIECLYTKRDYLLGETTTEKWFIECKHYKQGVPSNELLSILSSCTAEKVDRCIIIASGFLSNPAKEFIKNFESTNKPNFKISIWEKPKLENLTSNMNHLLRKYNIFYKDSILEYINPYHSEYIKDTTLNKLDTFISAFKKLRYNTRDHILQILNLLFFSNEINTIDFTNYDLCFDEFLKKCILLSNATSQYWVVHSISSIILNELLSSGNPLSLSDKKMSIEKDILHVNDKKEKIIEKARELYNQENGNDIEEFNSEEGVKFLEDTFKDSLLNLDSRQEKFYCMYNEFCNIVINELIQNKEF